MGIAACDRSGTSSPGLDDDDSDDDDDVATSPTPEPDVTPTLSEHVFPIMNSRCGVGDNDCHSRVAYAATSGLDCRGWLALENSALGAEIYDGPTQGQSTGCPDRPLHDRLTVAPLANSWECGEPPPEVPYVVPGDPAGSYLWRKINGGPLCDPVGGESVEMPPADRDQLSTGEIEVIRRWIEGGALP